MVRAVRSAGVAFACAALCTTAARPSAADPQANASVLGGIAGVGTHGRFWDYAAFDLAVRGDVMFLRDDAEDFGLGPYAEVGTLAFSQLDVGGGVSALLPVSDVMPLVLSAGAYARLADSPREDGSMRFAGEPGLTAGLFWGSRSYNYSADYVVTWWGVMAGYRYSLGPSHESALYLAAQFDLTLFGTPLVLVGQAIAGPTDEAASITPEAER